MIKINYIKSKYKCALRSSNNLYYITEDVYSSSISKSLADGIVKNNFDINLPKTYDLLLEAYIRRNYFISRNANSLEVLFRNYMIKYNRKAHVVFLDDKSAIV